MNKKAWARRSAIFNNLLTYFYSMYAAKPPMTTEDFASWVGVIDPLWQELKELYSYDASDRQLPVQRGEETVGDPAV